MQIADKAGDAVIGAALTAAITKLKSRFPKAKVTNAAGKEIHPTSSDESHSDVARE